MDGSYSEAKIQQEPNPMSPSYTLGMDGSDSASEMDGSDSASGRDGSNSEAKIQLKPNQMSPSYHLKGFWRAWQSNTISQYQPDSYKYSKYHEFLHFSSQDENLL